MDFNLTVIHCIDLTVALLALIFLYLVVRKVEKSDFVVTMLVMSMALMLNIVIFSIVYLIDNLDNSLFNIYVYSFWSSFIRLQDCVTVLWIAVYAWMKINGTNLSKEINKLIIKIKGLRNKHG
jgi:hypothetical protein